MTACPCQSGDSYASCCAPFHDGGAAPTALQLMRSRYAAFIKRDAAYLFRTCHTSLRAGYDARGLRDSFALAWCGLEIVGLHAGAPEDSQGMVHFRAHWRDATGVLQFHEERSRFVRDRDGAWVYRDAKG